LKAIDGKMRETDVANVPALLRIIQSLESKTGKSVVTDENFYHLKKKSKNWNNDKVVC